MSKLRVGADLGCLVPGDSGGLVNVVEGALTWLARRSQDMELVVFATPRSESVVRAGPNVEVATLPTAGFYEQLDRHLDDRRVDVLFRAYPTLERLAFPIERQIVLVPDLLHQLAPEYFEAKIRKNRRAAFGAALAGAGAIATISNYARTTIERFPGHFQDVFVMYPSVPLSFTASNSHDATTEERALVPDSDYFLYPANRWPSKNHERLIRAVRRYRESTGSQIRLVLTGTGDSSPQGLPDEQLEAESETFVHDLGYVRVQLLRLLYERATALVFFSLHEGFGIPVLEAFEIGTPVICSNVSSLPEVAGDAALTCNPTDIHAMVGLMDEIASNKRLREFLTNRGRERGASFSWARAADQLAMAVERVAARGGDERTRR